MGLNKILNCRPDVSQDNGGDIPAASWVDWSSSWSRSSRSCSWCPRTRPALPWLCGVHWSSETRWRFCTHIILMSSQWWWAFWVHLATWHSLVMSYSLILHTHHTDVITMVMSILSALGYAARIGHQKPVWRFCTHIILMPSQWWWAFWVHRIGHLQWLLIRVSVPFSHFSAV